MRNIPFPVYLRRSMLACGLLFSQACGSDGNGESERASQRDDRQSQHVTTAPNVCDADAVGKTLEASLSDPSVDLAALGEAFCVEVRRSSCDLSFTGEMLTGSVQRSTWTRYCESGPGADFDTEPEDDESGEDWQPERVPDGLSCVADGKVVVVRYREVANTGPLTRVKLTTENLSVLNWPLDGDEGDTIYIGDTGLVIDVEDPTQDATLTIEGLSEQGDVPYDCTVEFKAQS